MSDHRLGEFEELILLTVAVLTPDAYTVSVRDELERQADRGVHISAVHTALGRLEKKGMVRSALGGATEVRGGRRKRLYTLTASGKTALIEAREVRDGLWSRIPGVVWQ